MSHPTDDEMRANVATWRGIVPTQHSNWADSLVYVTEVINREGPTPSHVTTFWVRLWGVLADLGDFYSEPSQASLPSLAIGQLRSALTEDELIWIEYIRHTECHPVQDAYWFQTKKGKPRIEISLRVLGGRALPIEEWDKRADSFYLAAMKRLGAHSTQMRRVENAIVSEIAAKVLPHAVRLRDALRLLK